MIGALKQSLQAALHRATPAHGAAALDSFARRPNSGEPGPRSGLPPVGIGGNPQPIRALPRAVQRLSAILRSLAKRSPPTHAPMQQAPAPEDIEAPLGAARAQIHDNYIISQTRDGIVIVDQHAAHERLVYEALKAARAGKHVPRQALLIPAIVDMEQADVERHRGRCARCCRNSAFTSRRSGRARSPFMKCLPS